MAGVVCFLWISSSSSTPHLVCLCAVPGASIPSQALRETGDRQLLVRSGPVYILLQGIPCELTEAQLEAMALGAQGLDHVLTYNPYDPGFAVYVFRNRAGAVLSHAHLVRAHVSRMQPMCTHPATS